MTILRVTASLSLFIGSMAIGWWLGRRGTLSQPRATALVRFIIRGMTPVVLCFTLWEIEFATGALWWLPAIGVVVSLASLLPAAAYARSVRLSPARTGSMLTCAMFSNVGYLGAFTAFALFGEQAFGLCVLYFLLFSPTFYTIGFWLAQRYGHRADLHGPRPPLIGELQLYPYVGMALGALLNVFGVPRPGVFAAANHVLIPVDTALYLIAIGSQLTFSPPRRWVGASLAMSGIKFLYAPLIGWVLVTLLGYEGLPRFVVLLEASTPVAVSPLLFPLLFGLDREFSNAIWLFTNVVAIPWLLLVIPVLQRL